MHDQRTSSWFAVLRPNTHSIILTRILLGTVLLAVPAQAQSLFGARLFTDATLTTPGLVGSYVNRSLESVTATDDWRVTQVISGTRIDTNIAFTTGTWGRRADVGITGGSEANWDYFSVQWDGYLQVTQAGQRFATASDDGSRMWIDLDQNGAFEPEELLINCWGRAQGLSIRERTVGLPVGAYPIRIQYYELGGANEFYLVSSTWMPRPFVPSAGNPRQAIRVIVLNFEPRIPSEGNRRLWEVFGWNDPRRLVQQFEADLEWMTGGAIDVQIVEWRELDEFPLFTEGLRYTPEQ